MDLASLLGILGAIGIVAMAMVLGGSILIFINIPSVLIVFVGSLFVVLIKYNLGQFFSAFKIAGKAFKFKMVDLNALIEELVEMADIARKGGLLALEERQIDNEFLKKGVQLLVDGHDPDVIRALLAKDRSLTVARHQLGARIFADMGDVGPAMGMIGTLIGLVQMLSAMDDPKSIGPAMAVALLTTLYGAVLATMIAIPISNKLSLRRDEEALTKSMIIDAVLAIQEGQNPRVIESILRNYLPGAQQESGDE